MPKVVEEGELPIGIEVDGTVHRAFTLRPAVIRDNVGAVDEVGMANPVALNAAILARQLVGLGTLKPEQITYELMCDMDPRDFNELDAASSRLSKKMLPAPPNTPTGTGSASASVGSGSAGPTAQS